jgi:hypothetical protein
MWKVTQGRNKHPQATLNPNEDHEQDNEVDIHSIGGTQSNEQDAEDDVELPDPFSCIRAAPVLLGRK